MQHLAAAIDEDILMTTNTWTVRAQLAASFGLLAALVLLVSILAVRALGDGYGHYATYVNDTGARVSIANHVLDAANARAAAARNLLLVSTAADRQTETAAVQAAHARVTEQLGKLRQAVATGGGVSERERALFTEIEQIESRYGPVALAIVQMTLADQREAAIEKLNAECRPLLAALLLAADTYVDYQETAAAAEVRDAEQAYASNRNLMLAACALAVVGAMLLALRITRSLTRALGAEPAALGAAARRVADGDLGPVAGAAQATAGSVLASLADMQQRLAALVAQVRQASDSIATGSSEIATGNVDLSQRTEAQASNLQQTAASMEQLHSTVKHNADTARQATQLAGAASTAAHKGGEVVGQVVATMGDISSSARRIADIIGTIDGIAFQTNILALNAAVEAARAGDQGRGFAVVAGEVRALAQRSAEAAREIKSLIGASVDKVELGTRLVADAGSSMTDIVAQVQHVAQLLNEIDAATLEQTSGIGQVSDAVTQLDQVTQQNAALVEESAAAAESLQQQASRLAELVSVFRVAAA